jgi:rubrerythrin
MSVDSEKWLAAQATRKVKRKRSKSNDRILGPIEDVVFNEMKERNAGRDTLHLHPSEMAKADWCLRSTFYKMTGVEESNREVFSLRMMNIFAEGHSIHEKWQEWLRRAGVLWGDWRCRGCEEKFTALAPTECPGCGQMHRGFDYLEVDVYDDKHKIMGHTDGWIKDDEGEALLEIKTVGIGTLAFEAPSLFQAYRDGHVSLDEVWKRIKRPLSTHNRQIQLYMYVLGVDKAVVLYEWKPTQEVREFHIELDMDVVQPLLDGALAVLDSIQDGSVPLRPREATSSDSDICARCSFKDRCWEDE